jgi:hypothetical protein
MATAGSRLSRTTRWVLAGTVLALGCVLTTARLVRPDPKGYGTHTQLGLLPCGFHFTTGYPCPSCGMTTAFAWVMRGRFDRAWAANPAGSLLAPACVVAMLWLTACAVKGRPCWGARSIDGPAVVLVVATAGVSLLAWIFRLMVLGRVLG